MGGLLTCRQCSTRMECLKDHSLWDISKTRVRNCLLFILVAVIVFTLSNFFNKRAPPELGRKCPNDQARLLHNISQLEAEKVTLRKQLTKTEKEMEELRKVMHQTPEKSLQLLEKKQEEVDALRKVSSGFNQSLVLTRQFLDKEKEKTQSLQSQLEIAQGELRKTQQQRDSWQKQLKNVERNATSQVKEAVQREMEKNKVTEEENKHLKQQLSKLQQTNKQQEKKIQDLEDQHMKDTLVERSEGGLLLGPSLVLLPLLLAGLLL